MTQPVYICDEVGKTYFSRKGCLETNILPASFPFPLPSTGKESVQSVTVDSLLVPKHWDTSQIVNQNGYNTCYGTQLLQNQPLPVSHHLENLHTYHSHTLRCNQWECSQAKTIYLGLISPLVPSSLAALFQPWKPLLHTCILNLTQLHMLHMHQCPFHFTGNKNFIESLDADRQKGIIEPVPIGKPVEWCSHMVVVTKKNGKPPRTTDQQKLNAQCYRETHHCHSTSQLVCKIPSNTKKTVLDAVDGFHTIELDEASCKPTTFITEWRRYCCCHLLYLAAVDAYTRNTMTSSRMYLTKSNV